MTLGRLAWSLVWLVVWAGSASPVDLAKIDRRIAKEPTYQSKAPKYCLLVFGPQAKSRVWLVLDGEILYADRNGNGDLTEKSERSVVAKDDGWAIQFEPGDIPCPDSETKYTNLSVAKLKGSEQVYLKVSVTRGRFNRTHEAGLDWSGGLNFSDRPSSAPIVHFDGPLYMGLSTRELPRGPRPRTLNVFIGTPGLGKGTFACMTYNGIPSGICPVADIVIPKGDGGVIKASYALADQC